MMRIAPQHLPAAAALAVALLASGCGSSASSGSTGASVAATHTTAAASATKGAGAVASGVQGPEGVLIEQGPALAPASSTTPGTTVHGIQCGPVEQIAYHVHAHLAVYAAGQLQQIPAGIGIPQPIAEQTPEGPFVVNGKCFYWLHTHAPDGILHIESPTARIYTLGDFFAEWRQPLSATQVGSARGKVTAYLNGKRWRGSSASIPLQSHNVIQLDVGAPVVPYQPVASWGVLTQ
jgi:hypothetical protein